MDTPATSQQDALIDNSGSSSLVFLLKRGADYLRQGCYIEAGGVLALARAQLAHGQEHLAEMLDAFMQGYTHYQCIQNALLEISVQFAQAWTDLQERASLFDQLLSALIRDLETLPLSASHANDKSFDAQPPETLASQSRKESLTLSMPDPPDGASTPFPELYITCFSRFEVRCSGKLLMLCSNRAGQGILRYLVVKSGYSATSDTLKALFWPEDEPEAAQRKLHHAISALRSSLNHSSSIKVECSYIVCKNGLYSLNTAAVRLRTDVDEFLSYYRTGQKKSEERIALYEKACQLYTGPFLIEDIYSDWSALQREQLSRTYFAMCRVLTEHYLQFKCYDDAAKWASAILKENPCDETAHQQLIQIYAAQGYRSAAIQQYQLCERILREELGVGPTPETTSILQKIIMPAAEQRRSKNGEQT
jgi:DNA-binding SARP family transcriptional activator